MVVISERDYEDIRLEIIENWKKNYNFLGIKRHKIIKLSNAAKWKIGKVIALMRKKKEIYLNRWYYIIDLKKIIIFKTELIGPSDHQDKKEEANNEETINNIQNN